MVAKDFLIYGGCNVFFIIITIILIFVPIDNEDFGSTEVIGIVSIMWCFINAMLAFYFLKSKTPKTSNSNKIKRDYMHSNDNSEQISDENVQILIKDGNNNNDERTKTSDIIGGGTQIELQSIKHKLREEQERFNKEETKRRKIEYENKQIMDEYQKYKGDTADTARYNLELVKQCKALEKEVDDLQQRQIKQIDITNDENNENHENEEKKQQQQIQQIENKHLEELEKLRETHEIKLKEIEETYNELQVKHEMESKENEELQNKIREREELNNKYLSENDQLKTQIVSVQHEFNTMTQQIQSMQQKLSDHDRVKSEFAALTANSQIIQKQIDEYEERINELQEKEQALYDIKQENKELRQSMDELHEEMKQYKTTKPIIRKPMKVTVGNNRNNMHNQNNHDIDDDDDGMMNSLETTSIEIDIFREQISKLKKELAHAQKTIIEMTSVVGVQQSFPTVQETIQQYRSIRDQKHHDTSTLLKKFIKKNCGNNKWQKYYINQIVHEIMFKILIKCYKYNEQYRLQIYDIIANQLNMKHAIADAFEIDRNQIDNNQENMKIIKKQQIRLLSNIFGAYFKNNFKHVLQRKLYPKNQENKHDDDDEDDDEDDDDNHKKEGNLVDDILSLIINEYSDYLRNLGDDELNGLKEYIIECSEVCWVMILQDPPLHIQPSKWLYINNNNDNDDNNNNNNNNLKVYDERYHKRVLGSDRNCKNILYAVWPAVARNAVILGDQKIDVVLRNELYTEFKQKRGSVASTVSTLSNVSMV